ncbi:MAG: hypothetical protein ACLQAH_09125 [Limisphaerales bacterium]
MNDKRRQRSYTQERKPRLTDKEGEAWQKLRNKSCVMKRMMEVITEAVRDPKHPFRKLDHQPKKTLKNRYERRKIKEYLHLGDWQEEMV